MATITASDEEDDYLSMTIVEPESLKHETSVQRRVRKKKEAEARGRTKSKAEQAKEDSEILKTALLTPLDSSNKGFKMLQKLGYKSGSSLGINRSDDDQSARLQPIAVDLKNDRAGVGSVAERKRKFLDEQQGEMKHIRVEPDDFRVRKAKEKEAQRNESLWREALRIFEALEEEAARPEADVEINKADVDQNAKSVQSKEESDLTNTDALSKNGDAGAKKAARFFRRCLEQQRNPDLKEESFKDVFAQKELSQVAFDEALELQENQNMGADGIERFHDNETSIDFLDHHGRVDLIVGYLRKLYHYCFWCKHRYEESPLMEGCPGPNETDHD